jgi:hypothetical protein
VRKGWIPCAVAALLATVAPAAAQYGAPFGTPFGGSGLLTAPEAAGSGYGAGAAQQQQCLQAATGRDGPRGLCLNGSEQPPPPHR